MTNRRSRPDSPDESAPEAKNPSAGKDAEPKVEATHSADKPTSPPRTQPPEAPQQSSVHPNDAGTRPTPTTEPAAETRVTGPAGGATSAVTPPGTSALTEPEPKPSKEPLATPVQLGNESKMANPTPGAPSPDRALPVDDGETTATDAIRSSAKPELRAHEEAIPSPNAGFPQPEPADTQPKPIWWEPEEVVEPEVGAPERETVSEQETLGPTTGEQEAATPHHQVYSPPPMFIVHITPELAPVAKVGGLADVVFGLGKELEIRGNHVEFILPKYDCLRYDQIWELTETYSDLWVPWYGGAVHCTVYFGFVHGRKCFFIEPHSGENFFNRGCIYGFSDDIQRFAFFSRAALEFLWKAGKHPEIIHCHDWQTALVPVFLYEIYQHLGMTHPRVCFTIHNFKHQGVTGAHLLSATGLNRPEYYFHYDRLRDNHNLHALNLMKGGVVYANFTTTVSPRHASEAKDHGQGFGLEPTLHIHHQKYGGVVNGIDYEVWNPEIDRYIPFRYSTDTLDDKYKNKIALRDRLLIADNEKPIVAFIGRLDPQKGLELVRHAIFYTLHRRGQFVLLGSSPDSQINNYFWGLKHQLNENPDCHIEIGFNEELSHLIYAGADIVVVPSRFEPCGLTQLIALRYGTVPVVREVGGLADTVFDKDHSHRPLHERNGYVFRDYDFSGLESALGRAISCYYDFPEDFRELMKNGMRCDYSWKNPGQDYLNIYDYIRDK